MGDVKALRALLARATQGKWETDGDMAMYVFAKQGRAHTMVADRNVAYDPDAPPNSIIRARGTGAGLDAAQQGANLSLVVAAVNALPGLLDEVERLREAVAAEREACAALCDADAADWERYAEGGDAGLRPWARAQTLRHTAIMIRARGGR